jgi:hypothetical protein
MHFGCHRCDTAEFRVYYEKTNTKNIVDTIILQPKVYNIKDLRCRSQCFIWTGDSARLREFQQCEIQLYILRSLEIHTYRASCRLLLLK